LTRLFVNHPLLLFPSPFAGTFLITAGNTFNGTVIFTMNASTGVVTTAAVVDYETWPKWFTINVTVKGDGTAPGNPPGYSAVAVMTVNVTVL
jgi:hypothetical protein